MEANQGLFRNPVQLIINGGITLSGFDLPVAEFIGNIKHDPAVIKENGSVNQHSTVITGVAIMAARIKNIPDGCLQE